MRRTITALCAALVLMAWLPGLTAAQGPGDGPESGEGPVRLLALGDSLTAGFGLPNGDGFTDQLEAALRARGLEVEIINAGVSGDTTAGGLARLSWILDDTVTHAIVQLGPNDALRGLEPAQTRDNLRGILEMLKARGVPVLLAGMQAPRNLGPDYAAEFDPIYPDLAKEFDAVLYPFFLDGVALDPALNQDDGIHPTKEGVAIIVDRILPFALRLISQPAQP